MPNHQSKKSSDEDLWSQLINQLGEMYYKDNPWHNNCITILGIVLKMAKQHLSEHHNQECKETMRKTIQEIRLRKRYKKIKLQDIIELTCSSCFNPLALKQFTYKAMMYKIDSNPRLDRPEKKFYYMLICNIIRCWILQAAAFKELLKQSTGPNSDQQESSLHKIKFQSYKMIPSENEKIQYCESLLQYISKYKRNGIFRQNKKLADLLTNCESDLISYIGSHKSFQKSGLPSNQCSKDSQAHFENIEKLTKSIGQAKTKKKNNHSDKIKAKNQKQTFLTQCLSQLNQNYQSCLGPQIILPENKHHIDSLNQNQDMKDEQKMPFSLNDQSEYQEMKSVDSDISDDTDPIRYFLRKSQLPIRLGQSSQNEDILSYLDPSFFLDTVVQMTQYPN